MKGERSINRIQEEIANALSKLPDVFSTVQWGGRAYKLPGPNGNRKKPKLLAHVCLSKDGASLFVDFKLEKDHARSAVEDHDWIKPHSFRTLAPSGWVSAEVRTKAQCKKLMSLLNESRAMYPIEQRESMRRGKRVSDDDGVVHRIEAIVREKRASGKWNPGRDDFD